MEGTFRFKEVLRLRGPFLILCFLTLSGVGLEAQSDSLLRKLDRLGIDDILLGDSLLNTQVSGASRSLQNITDLPFTIYVIRREEILRNGYITLVDALKSMPGIRVSQPGSALEGETFTMRGLLGNTYAKILINGTPIKPFIVSGMPIGAQLPIQQADRIEVIYGPAAALYGADASSGIINIVVSESERPLFTKASLHIGADNYKSINLFFGGKVGRGDNLLRFKLYGTDTRFDDRRIFYERDFLYNPSTYFTQISDSLNTFNDPNFRGNNFQNTPHESRSLGAELQYRFLTLSVLNMNRTDHSSIGYNPAAVTYANPLTSTGEAITSAVLRGAFKFRNIIAETKLEYLEYNLNNRSGNLYVDPMLNGLLSNTIPDSVDRQAVRTQIEGNFFSNFRFMQARSREYSIEQTFNMPILRNGDLTIGFRYLSGNGNSLRDFQPNTFETLSNLNMAFSNEDINEYSAFIQFFKPIGKNFNLLLGGQYLDRDNGDFAAPLNTFNPRIAILYKYSEELQFRASYSTAVRAPSPFFSATSYTFSPGNYDALTTGSERLKEESTSAFELGGRWFISEGVDLDLSASYTRTDGFFNFNIAFEGLQPGQQLRGFTLGYFNDENSKAELLDFQSYLRFRNIIPSIQLSGTLGANLSRGSETLTTTNLVNLENEVEALEGLRAHPTILVRFSLQASPWKNFLIKVDQLYVSRTLTRNSFRLNPARNQQLGLIEPYNDPYYTVDLTMNYSLNKKFSLYIKGFNIFNAKYAGIDASSSNDTLVYNPQSLFILHVGLNYELN